VKAGSEVLSVAELDRRLRRAVESTSAGVWVEGEVVSLKRATSGHVYFTLKDEEEDAIVECVMYKFDAQRSRKHLVEGARIELQGKATIWAPRGRLQFVGSLARAKGRGALLEALEQLKQRLAEEGLFAEARKRPLPLDPKVVGVVTSKQGAAYHDIRTVAFRRASVRLVLVPALVQGESAPVSIVRAIDLIERYPGLDVLIVGRGGGSGEDLMAFNDERVVRRVARVKVPVVSAVGHEVDVTLTDLCADVRAATPSQAAELVVPDVRARHERLRALRVELGRALRGRLAAVRNRLYRAQARLADPRFTIAERQEELDDLVARLEKRFERIVGDRRSRLVARERRLLARHPRVVIGRAKIESGLLGVRLHGASRRFLRERRAELADRVSRLDALSPLAVLSRGYAIATLPDGRAVRDARALSAGDAVTVRVARGRFQAEVKRVESEESEK
jgi:exodeoxyribonuclease VII large subunit